MSITATRLYRDAGNFFLHQWVTVLLIALLTAFVCVLINYVLSPDSHVLSQLINSGSSQTLYDTLNHMTREQRNLLLGETVAYSTAKLLGNTLLIGSMLTLIAQASTGKPISTLNMLRLSVSRLPGLLLLIIIMSVAVNIGMFMLLLGIILFMLLVFTPIIFFEEKKGILDSMQQSVTLAWQNKQLVASTVLLWFAANYFLARLIPSVLFMTPDISSMLGITLGNMLSALLIIYLYRLYMLAR